ncbi:MAG TPA: cytochrome c oxidase subunit II [Limnochordales bacterium]
MATDVERAEQRPETSRGAAVAALIWAVLLAAVVGTWFAARRWWFPELASQQGAQIDRLFTTIFVIIGIVFVLVHATLGFVLWRYASRGGGHRAASWHENPRLELAWTVIPAVILVTLTVLGGSLWLRVHSAAPPGAMTVEVIAEQFGWRFHYPGPDGVLAPIDFRGDGRNTPLGLRAELAGAADDVVSRELYLVVDRPVRLLIRSKDVIHSFYVPHFRFKQDAVPGRVSQVVFTPTRTGTFPIVCAELCGVGHYVMAGTLKVVTADEFAAWLASQPTIGGVR